jgi:hypothetical protein
MTSMNDAPPSSEESYISKRGEDIIPLDHSSVPSDGKSVVGHQETVMNFHHLHNLTTVRSRGWGIGNPIVGLPPGAKDSYYTQPGSPYNEGSIRPRVNIGDLDSAKGGGRPYKSEKWADRLRTKQEREEIEKEKMRIVRGAIEREKAMAARRKVVMAARGNGTVAGSA